MENNKTPYQDKNIVAANNHTDIEAETLASFCCSEKEKQSE